MRKYIILFFLVFPFLFACNGSSGPDDIIPKKQMVGLLVAIHLADGHIMSLSQAPDTLFKYGTSRYLNLFEKFHIDSGRFRKSYVYYCSKPDDMQDMYDSVLKRLQTKNDSLNKELTKLNNNQQARDAARQRAAAAAGKPLSTFKPGNNYGVGVQPAVAAPTVNHAKINLFTLRKRMRARADSMSRAHLKDRHVISR